MALVYPFRGFRYNKEIVGDLSTVMTQPYDKTTPQMQEEYYRRSPYNVVRITLSAEKAAGAETDYREAGMLFRKWIEDRILIQDPEPAIYPYYQEYVVNESPRMQKGFIALLDLNNSESGIIPHENTLAAPKRDRLHLIRSLEGNEDLIYMLYSDGQLTINRLMDESISGCAPEIAVTDEYGVKHCLWALTDQKVIDRIQQSLIAQNLFIADGHHRFETAVNFMRECFQRRWLPDGTESFDKRMVACFNIIDGVTILPTHRLIRDIPGFDASTFLRNIAMDFSVEAVDSAARLRQEMQNAQGETVFGFYTAAAPGFYLLRLRRKQPEGTEPGASLDVNVLHRLLLERGLGIDSDKLQSQAHVDYEREIETCVRLVDEGKYQAAFFLNPTTAEQVQRIALRGDRMPQKSTDFYPKLLTGLVFMRMNIRK